MAGIMESFHVGGRTGTNRNQALAEYVMFSFSQPAKTLPKYVREPNPVRENFWDMIQGNSTHISISPPGSCHAESSLLRRESSAT